MKEKISIVIPCYNGQEFIKETLNSILLQQAQNLEIIIIDDGSTDSSKEIINEIKDPRIQYFYQTNKGVSAARNYGFSLTTGDFIVFFDADDVMSSLFLSERIAYLIKHPEADFVSGGVQKFDKTAIFPELYRGISNNGVEEVLMYDKLVVTCPSNFVFRKNFLIEHRIIFNERLASTADRFFLLQCIISGRAGQNHHLPPLLYRVSSTSMSGSLTPKLVLDNEKFYQELERFRLIPRRIRKKVLKKGNYIIAASFFKIGNYWKSAFYLFKMLF